VIVFNLLDVLENHTLDYWLDSIFLRTPMSPIFLVGTHLDDKRCTPEYLESVRKAIIKRVRGSLCS
jgi:hypothetical protein